MTAPAGAEHRFIKPEVISETSIGLLQRELVVANLLWRWSEANFKGAKDDTVNVKVPSRLKARDRKMRATGEDRKIKMDYLAESTIGVKLTEFPYSAVPITDEQMTMDIVDFGAMILQPQVRSIAEHIEQQAVDVITGATYMDGVDAAGTAANQVKGTLAAEDFYGPGMMGQYTLWNRVRRNLNRRKVPKEGRIVLVGSDVEEEILNSPNLVKANEAGDNSALRDATIGKLAGFTFVQSDYLEPTESYAFHRTAFVLATAAPIIPTGASFGSSLNAEGTALRWIKDYDADYAVDRSIVDTFSGTGVVTDKDVRVDENGNVTEKEGFLRGLKITMDPGKVAEAKASGLMAPEVTEPTA